MPAAYTRIPVSPRSGKESKATVDDVAESMTMPKAAAEGREALDSIPPGESEGVPYTPGESEGVPGIPSTIMDDSDEGPVTRIYKDSHGGWQFIISGDVVQAISPDTGKTMNVRPGTAAYKAIKDRESAGELKMLNEIGVGMSSKPMTGNEPEFSRGSMVPGDAPLDPTGEAVKMLGGGRSTGVGESVDRVNEAMAAKRRG